MCFGSGWVSQELDSYFRLARGESLEAPSQAKTFGSTGSIAVRWFEPSWIALGFVRWLSWSFARPIANGRDQKHQPEASEG